VTKKKKILICGSASFIMSNFIRYILYRSQDYHIVSVDNLEKLNDIKRIYFNKNHKFYIGDAADKYFMDRIICIEKPDIILFGDEILEYEKILSTALNLIGYQIPLFYLPPAVSNIDKHGICDSISKLIIDNGGYVIILPNRFGMRQRASLLSSSGGNIAYIIKSILNDKKVHVSNKSVPWVYAEDVASYLWYTIENREDFKSYSMPQLGKMSEMDIAQKIVNMYNIDCNINEQISSDHLILEHENYITCWEPDAKDIDSVLEKTIRWFDANRWAFNE